MKLLYTDSLRMADKLLALFFCLNTFLLYTVKIYDLWLFPEWKNTM